MKIITLFTIVAVFTTSCGFKVLKQSELQDFYISSIETTGDSRINFSLRNKLIIQAKDESKKEIKLNINTDKSKSIKEKNSSNEITKYLIKINLLLKIEDERDLIKTLKISDQLDYNVGTQYSQTINNERQAIKAITNKLAEKIIKEISLIRMNDL